MTKKVLMFFMGVLTSFLLCSPVFAENFYIENYDVNLQVNKSKQVHITENIDVYFTSDMHGIFRDIPHKNASVSNIMVSENNYVSESGSNTRIKIGHPNILLNGKHHYTITYDYNYFDNKNEFYHNIIGTGWDTEIRHVNFNITMPEEFNTNDVGISIGEYGVQGFDGGAEFKIDGLNITGQTHRILQPHEGITVRLAVADGYFNKVSNTKANTLITLLVLLTLLSFVIWYTFGKDEKAIPVVNFYPPKGMNTLEVEIAYNEKASTQGLVAMLISLAQRGYIKINDYATDFTLTRLKYYDGTDKLEKEFMSTLFAPSNSTNFKTDNRKISKHELETSETFYKNCTDIIFDANSKKNLIYEKSSVNWGLRIIMLLCLLSIVSITFLALVNFNISQMGEYLMPLLMTAVALAVILTSKRDLFLIIWALTFGIIPFLGTIGEIGGVAPYNLPILYTGLIAVIICSICLYHLKKRNKQALSVLGNLLGFKKFIETAEKHRLQTLVEKDPQYFYDVLPFAYLFGISDKWINKFEGIMKLQPDWYTGDFNYHTFNNFSDSMKSVSVPSVSNGGISTSSGGGGGFSGGGGGGGGGGGW